MPLGVARAYWLSDESLARSLASGLKLEQSEQNLGQVLHFHNLPKPSNYSYIESVCVREV